MRLELDASSNCLPGSNCRPRYWSIQCRPHVTRLKRTRQLVSPRQRAKNHHVVWGHSQRRVKRMHCARLWTKLVFLQALSLTDFQTPLSRKLKCNSAGRKIPFRNSLLDAQQIQRHSETKGWSPARQTFGFHFLARAEAVTRLKNSYIPLSPILRASASSPSRVA